MSTCCQTSDPWNTPTPGSAIVVPPGSVAVQIPQSVGCGCGPEEQGTGVVQGSTTGGATAFAGHPTVKTGFTVPAIGGSGGFYSAGASTWAVPGAIVWVSPFGHLAITGVSGELVSYTNLSIPAATQVPIGAVLLMSAPPAPEAQTSLPTAVNLSLLSGWQDANARSLAAVNGHVLRASSGRWTPYRGLVYVPLDAPALLKEWNPVPSAANGSDTAAVVLPSVPDFVDYFVPDFEFLFEDTTYNANWNNYAFNLTLNGAEVAAGGGCWRLRTTARRRLTSTSASFAVTTGSGVANRKLSVWVNGYYV